MSDNGDAAAPVQSKAARRAERRPLTEATNSRMVSSTPNAVHADYHWRQRLIKERASAAEWKSNWGFLEANKPDSGAARGNVRVPGPMHDFLLSTRGGEMPQPPQQHARTQRSARAQTPQMSTAATTARGSTPNTARTNRSTTFAATGASTVRPFTPNTPKSNGAAAAAATAVAGKPTAGKSSAAASAGAAKKIDLNADLALAYKQNKKNYNLLGSDQKLEGEGDDDDGITAVDKSQLSLPPALGLDAELALTLRPVQQQFVGASNLTRGVDPVLKYRFPRTAAQMIGWQTAQRVRLVAEANGSTAREQNTLTGHLSQMASTSLSITTRNALRAEQFAAANAAGGDLKSPAAATGPTAVQKTGGGVVNRSGLLTPAAAALYAKAALQDGVAHGSGAIDKTVFWSHGLKNHNNSFWT